MRSKLYSFKVLSAIKKSELYKFPVEFQLFIRFDTFTFFSRCYNNCVFRWCCYLCQKQKTKMNGMFLLLINGIKHTKPVTGQTNWEILQSCCCTHQLWESLHPPISPYYHNVAINKYSSVLEKKSFKSTWKEIKTFQF